VLQVAEQCLHSAAKEITPCAHGNGPDQGTHHVQEDELSRWNLTHPDHEGRDGPKPLHETEYKDQGSPEPIH